jgi:type IV secretory pathway TrbD component
MSVITVVGFFLEGHLMFGIVVWFVAVAAMMRY